MSAELLARAGEHVTCENGHIICRIARDIHRGDRQDSVEDYRDWVQPKPKIGTLICRCIICNAPWYLGGGFLHIEDRWMTDDEGRAPGPDQFDLYESIERNRKRST